VLAGKPEGTIHREGVVAEALLAGDAIPLLRTRGGFRNLPTRFDPRLRALIFLVDVFFAAHVQRGKNGRSFPEQDFGKIARV
jgi:hypothetical protein